MVIKNSVHMYIGIHIIKKYSANPTKYDFWTLLCIVCFVWFIRKPGKQHLTGVIQYSPPLHTKTHSKTQEWVESKLIFFVHVHSLTWLALHCRMWIWTPFPWLIPQDPQPFPAPHRKCHALCITIQTYFRAEKWKNWEKHRASQQSVPQLIFLWKMGYRSNRTKLPSRKHEIFSIVIPFIPSLLSSSNFLGGKVEKDDRELTLCFPPIIFLFLGVETPHRLVEDRISTFQHFTPGDSNVQDGIWYMLVADSEKNGLGANQQYRLEWWWLSRQSLLTCINGPTSTVKHVQYIHTFMTGYKFFDHLFEAAHLRMNRVTLTQTIPPHALRMCLWHLNGPRLLTSAGRPIIFCPPKDHTLLVSVWNQ